MTQSTSRDGRSAAPAGLDDAQRRAVLDVLEGQRQEADALLPILHGIQDALGFVPPASLPLIAHALNLSRAEVHGVLGFYNHFRSTAPGRHVLRICRAEACQAMGARGIEAHLRRRLGIGLHATSADGAITLEPVYCLGNCACAPSLMLDDDVHGRLTTDAVDRLLDACGVPA